MTAAWLRDGGAIPDDPRMALELHAPAWQYDTKMRKIATKKDNVRKAIGRSPGRADALALACWENSQLAVIEQEFVDTRKSMLDEPARRGLDPYSGGMV